MTVDRRVQDEESCVFKLSSNKLNTNKKGSRLNAQCHLDKDCFIVRNSYTADKHFVYLLYFYLITLLT